MPHGMSKLQSIHGAGHVNVGKYHADVTATLKDLYSFVGISGLNDLKTLSAIWMAPKRMSVSSSTIKITGGFVLLSDTRKSALFRGIRSLAPAPRDNNVSAHQLLPGAFVPVSKARATR
jgi:hypothetical protein